MSDDANLRKLDGKPMVAVPPTPLPPSMEKAGARLAAAHVAYDAAQCAENAAERQFIAARRDTGNALRAVFEAQKGYDLAINQERRRRIDPTPQGAPRIAAG
jgi:hypothetical protein